MWIARGTGERKGPEARWTVLQPSGARVRVGGRAKGGGESTGLWPEGLAIFYFFYVRRVPLTREWGRVAQPDQRKAVAPAASRQWPLGSHVASHGPFDQNAFKYQPSDPKKKSDLKF